MPLPKISTPTYELVLPSTGETIEYRPFLGEGRKTSCPGNGDRGHEADHQGNQRSSQACIKTTGIKVEKLPTFDIEYLFLNIRGKSVGEEVEVTVTCPDDNKTTVDVTIPVNAIGSEEQRS